MPNTRHFTTLTHFTTSTHFTNSRRFASTLLVALTTLVAPACGDTDEAEDTAADTGSATDNDTGDSGPEDTAPADPDAGPDNDTGNTATRSCSTDAQCLNGERCVALTCVTATGTCSSDFDCNPGSFCAGGTCIARPVGDTSDTGDTSDSGDTTDTADTDGGDTSDTDDTDDTDGGDTSDTDTDTPPPCTTDTDCSARGPFFPACNTVTGACVACTNDSYCPADHTCINSACIPNSTDTADDDDDDTSGDTGDECVITVPPNVLIVFDGSSSMEDDFPTARTAVVDVLNNTQTAINWGLMVYNCFGQTVEVACGPSNSTAIKTALYKQGRVFTGTTAYSAVEKARAYFQTSHAGEDNYILFIGDGGDLSCQLGRDNDDVATLIEETRVVDGVKTLVLGYSSSGSKASVLNDYAVAGGFPLTPDTAGRRYFYSPVNDATVLTETLSSLAKTIGVEAGTINNDGEIIGGGCVTP